MFDYDKIMQDVEWIANAINNPSYLLVKQDFSNMFELADDSASYVNCVIAELEDRGITVVRCAGRFISVEKK